jgi:ribosomal protein L25 (general stress protein Ctc)
MITVWIDGFAISELDYKKKYLGSKDFKPFRSMGSYNSIVNFLVGFSSNKKVFITAFKKNPQTNEVENWILGVFQKLKGNANASGKKINIVLDQNVFHKIVCKKYEGSEWVNFLLTASKTP